MGVNVIPAVVPVSGNGSVSRQDAPTKAYSSFKEVLNSVMKANKAETNDSAVMKKKIETAVNWLARYLGIKPGILLAIFDELGIDPNDMSDKMKFLEIINKIAGYFKLDDDQKKEIVREMGGILGFVFE